mgnify:CR=1 FL=1
MRCIFNLIASVVLAVLLVLVVNIVGDAIYPTPGGMKSAHATAEQKAEKAEQEAENEALAEAEESADTASAEEAREAEKEAEKKAEKEAEKADKAEETAGADSGGDKSFADMVAAADPAAGKSATTQCKACHTFKKGGGKRMGPNLYGVVGSKKASVEGFSYSQALKDLGGKWTVEALSGYLKNPSGFAPGNKMAFGGIKDDQKRAAVIAYLKSLSD